MDIQATKLEILQFILNSNKESIINKLKSIVDKEKEEEIVGYTIAGEPLTIEKMNAKLAKAEEDVKVGRVISDEDLAIEIESW